MKRLPAFFCSALIRKTTGTDTRLKTIKYEKRRSRTETMIAMVSSNPKVFCRVQFAYLRARSLADDY